MPFTRHQEEYQIQIAIVRLLEMWCPPNIFWFHPFNKAKDAREGVIAKRMGMVAGVPDLIFFRDSAAFCIELKTVDGKLSDAQKKAHRRIKLAGIELHVAYGLADAITILRAKGVIA